MRHTLVTLAASLAAAPFAAAQHSLIVSPDADFVIRGLPGTSALGAIDDQESILVTPDAQNPYEARPFRTFSVINTMHGDGDLDGDLNDTDKYGDLNCLFVKNRLPNPDTGPFEPGNLYMSCSFNTTAAVATANSGVVTVRDGDVVVLPSAPIRLFNNFVRQVFTEGVYGIVPVTASYNFGGSFGN